MPRILPPWFAVEGRVIAMPLALDVDEIHLWLAFHDEITDEFLHAAYHALLSVEERAQQARFYFARDRLRYLVTRAMTRTVLSRYASVAPERWVFAADAYGRPYIETPVDADGLCFNISHTGGLIVLGIARHRALGVDVENALERRAAVEVAERFFAPAEVSALLDVDRRSQPDRFFEYWTFKESYIKARGMGLSLPLDKFSFHFPSEGGVEFSAHPDLADDAHRWQFWQFRPTPAHVLAVCAQRIEQPTRLTAMRIVPTLREQPVAMQASRVSRTNPRIRSDADR